MKDLIFQVKAQCEFPKRGLSLGARSLLPHLCARCLPFALHVATSEPAASQQHRILSTPRHPYHTPHLTTQLFTASHQDTFRLVHSLITASHAGTALFAFTLLLPTPFSAAPPNSLRAITPWRPADPYPYRHQTISSSWRSSPPQEIQESPIKWMTRSATS